jgi:hypothetical protein
MMGKEDHCLLASALVLLTFGALLHLAFNVSYAVALLPLALPFALVGVSLLAVTAIVAVGHILMAITNSVYKGLVLFGSYILFMIGYEPELWK